MTVRYRTVGRSATEGADYEAASGTLTFLPGETRKTVRVWTLADATDEPNETLAVRLRNPVDATLRDAVGVGTIVGDVERRAKRAGRSLLPELGRALAFDAVKCRLDQAFSGAPPASLTQALSSLPLPSRVRSLARSQPMSLGRLLGSLSFAMQSKGRADGTGRLTAWSCGAFPRLADGGGDPGVDWDGAMANLELGADLAVRPGMLAGLSLSRSSGSFDYRTDAGGAPVVESRELRSVAARPNSAAGGARVGGKYELRMVRVHPYLAWSVSRGVEAWGTLGLGRGELRTKDDLGGSLRSRDATLTSGAGGISAWLFKQGSSIVKLKGEAGLARFRVAGGGAGLAAESSGMLRLKLAAEASHEYALPSGVSLAPRGEIGLRHDGGDGETGAGIELGAGLRFRDPGKGWTVDGFGRRLMTRGGALPREWGFGASFTVDADRSGLGPSARLTQSWGRTGSGLHRLWKDENIGGSAERAPGPRLELQLGYGFGAFGGKGVLTPFGAVGLDGDTGRGYRAGARLDAGPGAALSLEVERRERDGAAPDHAAMLRGKLRF